jgi:hypothetical protein
MSMADAFRDGGAIRARRARYDEEVRAAAEEEITRVRLEGPTFRLVDVSRADGRLVIRFHRDSAPGVTFAYWTYIWEQVQWHQSYRFTSPLGSVSDASVGWVNDFIFQMDLDLDDDIGEALPDADGTRWLRARLVWS